MVNELNSAQNLAEDLEQLSISPSNRHSADETEEGLSERSALPNSFENADFGSVHQGGRDNPDPRLQNEEVRQGGLIQSDPSVEPHQENVASEHRSDGANVTAEVDVAAMQDDGTSTFESGYIDPDNLVALREFNAAPAGQAFDVAPDDGAPPQASFDNGVPAQDARPAQTPAEFADRGLDGFDQSEPNVSNDKQLPSRETVAPADGMVSEVPETSADGVSTHSVTPTEPVDMSDPVAVNAAPEAPVAGGMDAVPAVGNDGDNGHGNDAGGVDASNPGQGASNGADTAPEAPAAGGTDAVPTVGNDGDNGHGNDANGVDASNPGQGASNGAGTAPEAPVAGGMDAVPPVGNDGDNGHGNDANGVDASNPGQGASKGAGTAPEAPVAGGMDAVPAVGNDGDNGHGNDAGGVDASNPGQGASNGADTAPEAPVAGDTDAVPPVGNDGDNGHGNDAGGVDASNPGQGVPGGADVWAPLDTDGDNGHGNEADGVDASNPGQGVSGAGNAGSKSSFDTDHDNGHGNDADGFDESNPGKGIAGDQSGDGASVGQELRGTGQNDAFSVGVGDDWVDGGQGDGLLFGAADGDILNDGGVDDFARAGEGDDLFLFAEGGGFDVLDAGGGWTEVIKLQGKPGQMNVDWTLNLTEGEVVESGEDYAVLTQDSAGSINLSDGSELTFEGVDRVEW